MATADDAALAGILADLYALPGTDYYEATGGRWRHVKRELTDKDLIDHVAGTRTLGLPSVFGGKAKWISADIDSLDPAYPRALRQTFEAAGLTPYVFFSGRKGYHVAAFLDAPTDVAIVSSYARELQNAAANCGARVCKMSPIGIRGDNVKLPLGVHQVSGNRCWLATPGMEPVPNPLPELSVAHRVQLDVSGSLNLATGEIKPSISTSTCPIHFSKPCLDVLWKGGLQMPGINHSAIFVLANALVRSGYTKVATVLLQGWCHRAWEVAHEYGMTGQDLTYWKGEAQRACLMYAAQSFAPSCHNPAFGAAMRSACNLQSEMACMVKRNGSSVDLTLLRRMRLFAAANAKPPGLGKAAQAVYEAAIDILEDLGSSFEYQGRPAVALPQVMIQELAAVSQPTATKSLRLLTGAGLLQRVPKNAVPSNVLVGTRRYYLPAFYTIPKLDVSFVASVLDRVRARP